jgi:ABC-2 type transport system ATP-binding protein
VAVLLNSHLIGEVERVCDRVVILDRGRVAASGTLAELLGQHELRLELSDVTPAAAERLAAAGTVERVGDSYTVRLTADTADTAERGDSHDSDTGNPAVAPTFGTATAVPDLVRDLVCLGARVHAVEPARISLEARLLGILRAGHGAGE